MLMQRLFQHVRHFDVPTKQHQLFLAAVDYHINVAGDLRGQGDTHHPSHNGNMAKRRHIRAFQGFGINIEQPLRFKRLLHRPRFFQLNNVVHRHLKLRHNLSLEVTHHKIAA